MPRRELFTSAQREELLPFPTEEVDLIRYYTFSAHDPFLAIEQILSWEQLTESVSEAEKLARPEDFDYLALLVDNYPQLRRYSPAFLGAFEFKAAPAARNIIEAGEVLMARFRL